MRPLALLAAMGLVLAAGGGGAQAAPLDIVIVTDIASVEDTYVTFLHGIYGLGASIEAIGQQYRDLDATKMSRLESADLIIVSRQTDSGNYNNGTEGAFWNGLAVPMILHSAYLARGVNGTAHRWGWLDGDQNQVNRDSFTVMDNTDAVFDGLAVNNGDVVTMLGAAQATSVPTTSSPGNGTLIAKVPEASNYVAIVRWEGDEVAFFGDGTDLDAATPGGPRAFFALPLSNAFFANATADATAMLTNALTSLVVPEPASLAVLALGGLALLRRRRR